MVAAWVVVRRMVRGRAMESCILVAMVVVGWVGGKGEEVV